MLEFFRRKNSMLGRDFLRKIFILFVEMFRRKNSMLGNRD